MRPLASSAVSPLASVPVRPAVAWALALAASVFAVIYNAPWGLMDSDQAKQAFVSWEMADEGRFWFQHTPSGKCATKPPLMGWISWLLAVATPLGWQWAWRLPSFAAAVALVWLLWREGRRHGGSAGGVLAASAFAFNLVTPKLATLVRTDMVLALTIFGAGLIVLRHVREDRAWTTHDRWLLALVVGLSCFVKGPIIFAFVFAPVVLAAAWGRWRGDLPLRRAWTGLWPWLVALVPFAAWTWWGIEHVEGFREEVVGREFAGRFTVGEEAVHNNQPVYYYLPHLLHKMLPWSLVLVWVLCVGPLRRRLASDPESRFLLWWLGGALLVMSVIPSKRFDRIFPVVPVIALLIPRCLDAWAIERAAGVSSIRRWATGLTVVAILAGGGYSVAKPILEIRANTDALLPFSRRVLETVERDGLRAALVKPRHEEIRLYLRDFLQVAEKSGTRAWLAGEVDALVGNRYRIEEMAPELGPFREVDSAVATTGKEPEYVFIVRESPPAANTGGSPVPDGER